MSQIGFRSACRVESIISANLIVCCIILQRLGMKSNESPHLSCFRTSYRVTAKDNPSILGISWVRAHTILWFSKRDHASAIRRGSRTDGRVLLTSACLGAPLIYQYHAEFRRLLKLPDDHPWGVDFFYVILVFEFAC